MKYTLFLKQVSVTRFNLSWPGQDGYNCRIRLVAPFLCLELEKGSCFWLGQGVKDGRRDWSGRTDGIFLVVIVLKVFLTAKFFTPCRFLKDDSHCFCNYDYL